MQFHIKDSDNLALAWSAEPALLEYGDDDTVCELKYGVIELSLWEQESITKKQLFSDTGLKKKMRTFYLDVPHLHE